MPHILEGRPLGRHNHIGEQRIVGVNMRASLDRRDDRHANVGYVFQHLAAFVVNLAPNAGICDVAKRSPIDANNEVPGCTSHDHDLVRSVLRNPVKSVNNLRMMERRESARPAVAVEFDNQHTVGVSRQLQAAISGEVVLVKLHRILLSGLPFQNERSFLLRVTRDALLSLAWSSLPQSFGTELEATNRGREPHAAQIQFGYTKSRASSRYGK